MQSLTKRRQLLESVKLSTSLDQIHVIRRHISDVYQEQIRTANEKTQEKHLSRMAMIKEKLRASEYFLDQEIATQRRDGLDTGQWIFEEPDSLSWADPDALDHSVLYINGIPGAGKTTLVSLIISKLLEVHAPSQPLQVSSSVSYFYFKHGDVEKNSHESALRAILTQLISQNAMSSQTFLEDFSKQADVNVRSRQSLETLTKRALEEYRVSYLILDGLDECEREQAQRTMEWLLSLLEDDQDSSKTSLRLLFSGQRDGLLDNVLSGFPSIRLESKKHDADIANYCSQYASKLKQKFRLTKELETHIGSLVTKDAQGMFLYARIVLEYLFRQVSLRGLKNAISPGSFPRKLETAYQRIAATILDPEFKSEMEAARKLACVKGNMSIVNLILETYAKTANFANSGIRIGFMKAVAKGHLETVELLITYYDFTQDKDMEDGPSDPLLVACERHHASMLDLLLQNGFEFHVGVNYLKKCIPANHLRDTEEGWKTREQALKIVLESGQPQISRLEILNLATRNAQPSMVLLILSYPKTDLVEDDLFGLRLRLAPKAQYSDVVKLIDKLLQVKKAEH
ncbi:zinc finger protein [Colletotrichum kahawae]|uniref:Zinc finger protein n=1 Tax=Colletotrichum kahawae TaxID=34407 RepID=A0AAD9YAK1_COLKA|nr:zinc finger protein [Colletotrichum kahawae]